MSEIGDAPVTDPPPGETFSQLPPVVVDAVALKENGPLAAVEIVNWAVPAVAPCVKEKLRLVGSALIAGAPAEEPTMTVTGMVVVAGFALGTVIVTVA